MATIPIDISVLNNTLIVGANGGSARGLPGTKIVWRAASQEVTFTLEFFQLATEAAERKPINVQLLKRWPFNEPQPPNGVVGPTREFLGTLSDGAGGTQFKYYVTVGNLRLDPIIIVDK